MSGENGPDHRDAVGRTERQTATIDPERVEALAATLDLDEVPGDMLPAGWHWMFFNPFVRRRDLGADGHPKRGGFLPDTGLPRRMWAGGRLVFHAPLPLGVEATRESEIIDVSKKSGRTGRLAFVTVRHRIVHDGTVCVEEEQDLVYRVAPQPDAPAPKMLPAPNDPEWSQAVRPDPVLLFRYSALTFNGHRIHYDAPYAREEEGYRDLVVHGPLIATLLMGLAARCMPDAHLVRFGFRGMAPLFVDRGFHIEAARARDRDGLSLWARGPERELAMRAEAEFR